MRPARPSVGDLTHGLLAATLSVKIHAEQGRPDLARHQLYQALDLLADLDAAMPPQPSDAIRRTESPFR